MEVREEIMVINNSMEEDKVGNMATNNNMVDKVGMTNRGTTSSNSISRVIHTGSNNNIRIKELNKATNKVNTLSNKTSITDSSSLTDSNNMGNPIPINSSSMVDKVMANNNMGMPTHRDITKGAIKIRLRQLILMQVNILVMKMRNSVQHEQKSCHQM